MEKIPKKMEPQGLWRVQGNYGNFGNVISFLSFAPHGTIRATRYQEEDLKGC